MQGVNRPRLALRGYIDGLTLSNDGGTPNTKLDVAGGACRQAGIGQTEFAASGDCDNADAL